MKPETVLRAARLIKTGEVFELGRVLAEGDAAFRRPTIRDPHQAHAERSGHEPSWLERGAGRVPKSARSERSSTRSATR